jgi:hypothetical protein
MIAVSSWYKIVQPKKVLTDATIWYLRFTMRWVFDCCDRLFTIPFWKSKRLEVL